jgi:hypothetical protein
VRAGIRVKVSLGPEADIGAWSGMRRFCRPPALADSAQSLNSSVCRLNLWCAFRPMTESMLRNIRRQNVLQQNAWFCISGRGRIFVQYGQTPV